MKNDGGDGDQIASKRVVHCPIVGMKALLLTKEYGKECAE